MDDLVKIKILIPSENNIHYRFETEHVYADEPDDYFINDIKEGMNPSLKMIEIICRKTEINEMMKVVEQSIGFEEFTIEIGLFAQCNNRYN